MAKVEKGIVFTSNNVIDYAEGGVVSKELVHSKPHHSMLSFRLLMEKWS